MILYTIAKDMELAPREVLKERARDIRAFALISSVAGAKRSKEMREAKDGAERNRTRHRRLGEK